jgi:glycosyltransferase involved in cell wall biosynthesis
MIANPAQAAREQAEILGFTFADRTSRPLRILGLMPWREFWSMGRGAGATAFTRSPAALAAYGHTLHVMHPASSAEPGVEELAGAHFHRFRCPEVFSNPDLPLPSRLWSRGWRYLVFQSKLRAHALRLGREIHPDVVIAYDVMTAPAGRWVASRLGVPLVGRYFGNTLSLALASRARWYGNFMERIGFRVPVAAMILTNDGSPVLDVLRRLRVDRTPIHFLRNGIPAGVFAPGPRPAGMLAALGLPEDAFVIMSVTRLHSEKRLDRLIRALARVRPECPAATAILLGQGPERARLESLAESLGVASAVRFPGAVKNVALPEWYRLADIVVSLLDRTNASNPVFEAMACERCVVALDVGTTAEVVRHAETGLLVPAGDEVAVVRDVAQAVLTLARDPARRAELGRRARPFILELCGTVEERMRREIAVIEEAARSRSIVRGNLSRA